MAAARPPDRPMAYGVASQNRLQVDNTMQARVVSAWKMHKPSKEPKSARQRIWVELFKER